MHILNYASLDITGFAGIRERLLVMDRRYFKSSVSDEVRDGFGACVYLAHAYLTPRGTTERHFHQNIDIITVFTRGEIMHEGTLGHGQHFYPGNVLVQCSGTHGFQHNEMNVLNEISGMVQIWCQPSMQSAKKQEHQVIDVREFGMYRLYGGAAHDKETFIISQTQLDLAVMAAKQSIEVRENTRLYVIEGDVQVTEKGQTELLPRGTLCDGLNLSVQAVSSARVLIQTLCE